MNAVDFFCGGGGMTKGLRNAGIQVLFGVDLNPACQATYENNNHIPYLNRDISQITGRQLLEEYPLLADNDNFIYIQDTIWKNVDFKLISRGGHIYGIEKLDNYEDLVYDIWSKFTPFFTSNYLKLGSLLEINFHNLEQYDDIGVQEGEENLIKHIIRERNSKVSPR